MKKIFIYGIIAVAIFTVVYYSYKKKTVPANNSLTKEDKPDTPSEVNVKNIDVNPAFNN